ncbi:MAG: EAL domain-containing protein, partial [Acidimicrobiales bacterium]
PTTMMSDEFRSFVKEITAERIVLEVTEHSEIDDYACFGDSLSELRSNGVRLAVDDAGAGFASFRHILNIQPDIIKLDVALTRGIDADPARQALGSALLTFGLDAFNAGVVAEGIENERELATLRALGYPFGQGYHLGRPGPVPQIPLPAEGMEDPGAAGTNGSHGYAHSGNASNGTNADIAASGNGLGPDDKEAAARH